MLCFVSYLHTRIILLRPLLLVLFQGDQNDPDSVVKDDSIKSIMNRAMLNKVSELCIATAQNLVDFIMSRREEKVRADVLPAWWYCIFCTIYPKDNIHCRLRLTCEWIVPDIYTSATVILTARICPSLGRLSKRSLTETWNQCLAFLNEYKPVSKSACKGYNMLCMLDAQFAHPELNHESRSTWLSLPFYSSIFC